MGVHHLLSGREARGWPSSPQILERRGVAIHFLVLLLYDILVFRLERQGVAILSPDSREARVALHVLIMSFITSLPPSLPSFLLEGSGVAIHSLGSRETRGG